jgi:hypothetical protein
MAGELAFVLLVSEFAACKIPWVISFIEGGLTEQPMGALVILILANE